MLELHNLGIPPLIETLQEMVRDNHTQLTHPHPLTESHIRRWIDERSFERGWRYFEFGHILNPRRQGDTLKARCLGSRPQPYHVEVTLGPDGIVTGACSCPVGAGGQQS